MHIDALDHLVLTVRDVAATCDWYRSVLGMEAITFGAERRALAFGSQKINLHKAGHEFEPKAGHPMPGYRGSVRLARYGPFTSVTRTET
jgi:catechol 2,3-dioxygenase-like lactoylglutathione lyase family enzyme